MQTDFTSILCIADINISGVLEQCLRDLALPEVFIQSGKQMTLADKQGFLALRPVTRLQENRALLYRMYVPAEYEEGVMNRIAEVTDLKMGGRGFILAQHIGFRSSSPLVFDTEKLDRLCGRTDKIPPEEHAMIICTVPRGSADALSEAVLELGVCVPVVFFGSGVGLRDKLGLMRITVPVEKEIIWFIIPRAEAELVERTLIPRARLDVPGQGFLYKNYVHAPVVNLRFRQGKRKHAASMEQVIAAIDEVRGSSDWRRIAARKHSAGTGGTGAGGSGAGGTGAGGNKSRTRALFFIGEEEDAEIFRRTAMECGARGATLNTLEMRSYSSAAQGQTMVSHSRHLCDIITSPEVEEKLRERLNETGLFENGRTCVIKTFDVEVPSVLPPGGRPTEPGRID